eukprot:TRINITY_DN5090_c0_g3_i1.p1 TRINITY_DN5090_c0_g3~~TRINITY_DN5090_c0_g3_i1.p1  ORF type:complete len:236 (-),score=28.29 TRINITY_DN5090_c0_g3_i1:536-1198(-)
MVSADMYSSTPKEVSEIFLRTRRCRFFGMGKCTRGSACNFAHTTEELRPRLNLSYTKMCPTLLKTGSCTVDGCCYAHRREDRRRRTKEHRQGSNEVSRNQLNPGCPPVLPALVDGASPLPLVDYSTSEARIGAAKVGGNRDALIVNVPAVTGADGAALEGSVKDVVSSQGFLHHGFRVSVKNTFIDVENPKITSSVGLRRSSSAPGNIRNTGTIKRSVSH